MSDTGIAAPERLLRDGDRSLECIAPDRPMDGQTI